MNNLFKCLLITALPIVVTGCSVLGDPTEVEYITPKKHVSLNLGESAIVHGAMENCGREPRSWVDVSIHLPVSDTGFFSNAGRTLMKSDKCNGRPVSVLAVRFTANQIGTENLTVLGDPMTIVVGNAVSKKAKPTNFLEAAVNPEKAQATQKTDAEESSMLQTLYKWIQRDNK